MKQERYEINNEDCLIDTKENQYVCNFCELTLFPDIVVDLLNQQDARIKELEEENLQLKEDYTVLKQSKEHFKKVAENVVDLLSTLNKELPNRQLEELNYKKCIDDAICLIKENQQLKQSQNQKAIKVLKKVKELIRDNSTASGYLFAEQTIDVEFFEELIDDQIKALRSEK